jgi:hypothetical protein
MGRKPWRGMEAMVETPPDIRFSGTVKESIDGAETPEEGTRQNIGNDRQPGPVSPKRGARNKEAHTNRHTTSWPVEEHDNAAVSPRNRAWLSPLVLQSTQVAS